MRREWHTQWFDGPADQGRFPVGALITVLVIAVAAFGAYWALGTYGFLGGEEPEVEAAPEVEESAVDDRPEWLHGTDYELKPLATPEDPLEPPSHELEDWVWEVVDDTWTMTVVREGTGDNYTWLSDFQALYLVSPTDDLFKVSGLRTEFNMDLVHWDLEQRVAWIVRGGKSDLEQVFEYDLVTLDSTDNFAGNVFNSSNVVRGGVANLTYHGTQPDGRELWVTHSPRGFVTGVAWRDGEVWEGSLITDQIRRMAQQDIGEDRGVDAWFDPESGRAVYHGVFTDPNTKALAEELWVTHDFSNDFVDDRAVVPVPRDDCAPVGGPAAGTFEGMRIVATCGGVEYLLDPYDLGAPVER